MNVFKGWFPFWASVMLAVVCITLVVLASAPGTEEPFDLLGSLTPGETVIIHKVSEADFD